MSLYLYKETARTMLIGIYLSLERANEELDVFLAHIPCQGREKQLQHMRNRIDGLVREVKEIEDAIKK